jgi:hypothetical protein
MEYQVTDRSVQSTEALGLLQMPAQVAIAALMRAKHFVLDVVGRGNLSPLPLRLPGSPSKSLTSGELRAFKRHTRRLRELPAY